MAVTRNDMPSFTPEEFTQLVKSCVTDETIEFSRNLIGAFPRIAEELRRLWEHEEHYKRMIQNMHIAMEKVLEIVEEQKDIIESLKKA